MPVDNVLDFTNLIFDIINTSLPLIAIINYNCINIEVVRIALGIAFLLIPSGIIDIALTIDTCGLPMPVDYVL